MHFFRNWLPPILFAGLGALLSIFMIGLAGLSIVQTLDGSPVVGGFIPPEQVSTIVNQGKKIGSYIDFYGLALPGEPFYWIIGIIAVLAFIGYRVGSHFRAAQTCRQTARN